MHRTFLEYFCAAEIVSRFEKKQTLSFDELKMEIFLTHYQDSTWHEVLLLICGMVASHFASQLIKMLVLCAKIDKNEWDNPLRELLFVRACLDEAIEPKQVKEVSQSFQLKLRQSITDQVLSIRITAVETLAQYPKSLEMLLLFKQIATDDKHEYVRSTAVKSLAKH